jgi:CSLREA domain-containing protein
MAERKRWLCSFAAGSFGMLLSCILMMVLSTNSVQAVRDQGVKGEIDVIFTTFVVNSKADSNDGSCSTSAGGCTLREAILAANATAGNKVINFDVDPPRVIALSSALPTLKSGNITIDGYSQDVASPDTDSTVPPLPIFIDGGNHLFHGFQITSTNNTIKGLAIGNFGTTGQPFAGVLIYGVDATHNTIAGNYIGTNVWGSTAQPNDFGVVIGDGAQFNTIGGSTAADRNLISGNFYNGVTIGTLLDNTPPMSNTVAGNYIGLDWMGSPSSMPNGWVGIFIGEGTSHNLIGGDQSGAQNIITCNGQDGIYIHGTNTRYNRVQGNVIGVKADLGWSACSNSWNGVRIDGGASFNTIGGDSEASGNTIAGNDRDGVRIQGSDTFSNTLSHNFIGLTLSDLAGSNSWHGVVITGGASYNSIAFENVISNNEQDGVLIYGEQTMYNVVAGNLIGTNISGDAPRFNIGNGILIQGGADHNTIGGASEMERNILSGNGQAGLRIEGGGSNYNVVMGNYIGTDISGLTGVHNSHKGINLTGGASYNTIGGDTPGEGNVIAGNYGEGINIETSGSPSITMKNLVQGNFIGVGADGLTIIPNSNGIEIISGAISNTIGGEWPQEGNLIGGSDQYGIWISGVDTRGNEVKSNAIGSGFLGVQNLGNADDGIRIDDSAHQNTIGPHNIIAFNGLDAGYDGILAVGAGTEQNFFTQNSIYGNGGWGIGLASGANNGIAAPVITSEEEGSIIVAGTACPYCLIELFGNPMGESQGRYYLDSRSANASGNFSFTLDLMVYPNLTATATDPDDGTSQFSSAFTSQFRVVFLPLITR